MSAREFAVADVAVDGPTKRRRVRLLVTIVLLGTVISIAFHYAMGYWRQSGYPYSTFLFLPGDHFNDWDNPYLYAQAFLHGNPAPFVYFPFAFLVVAAATVLPMRVGFFLLIAVFLAVMVKMLRGWVVDIEDSRLVRLQYGFILVALSYPVLFALDRTNLELLIFVFLAGFFYFLYVRDKLWLAALALAAAISFKLYPATLLVLLLAERRFKTLLLTIALAIALTIGGSVILATASGRGVGNVWHMALAEKSVNQQNMVDASGGIAHSHTLWGLTRLPLMLRDLGPTHWQTSTYAFLVAALFVLLAWHVVFRESERWKRVALLVVASILLPYVSGDYTLIQMYFPLVFFLNSRRVSRYDVVYTALFAVILIPVDYLYFRHHQIVDVSISAVVYPLALLALMLLAVLDRSTREQGAPKLGALVDR